MPCTSPLVLASCWSWRIWPGETTSRPPTIRPWMSPAFIGTLSILYGSFCCRCSTYSARIPWRISTCEGASHARAHDRTPDVYRGLRLTGLADLCNGGDLFRSPLGVD